VLIVPTFVSFKFGQPIIEFGTGDMAAAASDVLVPKAPVDLDNLSSRTENEVWSPW
jgi:hypothetical protein